MTNTDPSTAHKPLRLLPGIVLAALLLLVRFVLPVVIPDSGIFAILGGLGLALAIIVWWVFFSRAPWSERLAAIAAMVVAALAVRPLIDKSILGGAMGMMYPLMAVPVAVAPALVAWAAISRRMSAGARYASMVVTFVLACAGWGLVRTDGMMGAGRAQIKWRWTPTAEQRLLAQADEPKSPPPAPAAVEPPKEPPAQPKMADAAPKTASEPTKTLPAIPASAPTEGDPAPERPARRADWPGFRGPERDGVVRGVRIATDWAASPPVQLWHRAIGPGWSSFAVDGDFLYTQEQRGDDEVVSCYRLSTGEPVWRHKDSVRFWESNAGAGPRATPTLSNGRVYAFGATGILNALDAASGAVVWSRNAAGDTKVKVPGWGFSSSPLVVDDVVLVAVSGALAAYDARTGQPRWSRPSHGGSYSSPHRMTIDGVVQVVFLGGGGATSLNPSDGTVLWENKWEGTTIVQPAVVSDGDVLVTTSDGMGGVGARRLAIAHGPSGWTVEERWTSRGLKPYFNDYVVHKGHAYGFDGAILSCIDLNDGERKWKGGRYGNGQMMLLAEQDLILVLSEEGEMVLVKAMPDQFTEVGRFKAIEGKTWNHPALVRDTILVRNGEEMAAFRLPLANR